MPKKINTLYRIFKTLYRILKLMICLDLLFIFFYILSSILSLLLFILYTVPIEREAMMVQSYEKTVNN